MDEAVLELPSEQFGRPKAPAGTWGSCIRIVDPIEVSCFTCRCHQQADIWMSQNKTVRVVHLDNNEAAFSLAVVPFEARENELHLVVGTAQDTLLLPRSCTSGFLRVYKFTDDGADLELVHKVNISGSHLCCELTPRRRS